MGARAVRGGGEGRTIAIAGSRAAAPQPEEGSAAEEEEQGQQGKEGTNGARHHRPCLSFLDGLLPALLERFEVLLQGSRGVGRAGTQAACLEA